MALGTNLPLWPALLFAYIEPAMLIGGWQSATFTPQEFVSKQVPSPTSHVPITASAEALSYLIGNVYLLLAPVAILSLIVSRETRVAKFYLFFIALADLGHVYACYRAMGPALFWDWRNWNDMGWGNIGVSMFLHVNRLASLLGLFGRLGPRA